MPDFVRLRNVSSDSLTVPAIGRTVGPDCVVDITRQQFEHQQWCRSDTCNGCRVWPPATWRDETPARTKTKERS